MNLQNIILNHPKKRLWALFGLLIFSCSMVAAIELENQVWEIFADRSWINAITLSQDEETLWVGTNGSLEQRDASSGLLERVFTNLDGLPHNHITALLSDGSKGIWIGTWGGGLAHRNVDGEWTKVTYPERLSSIVTSLASDRQGGLWVGTYRGFAYRSVNGQWTLYNATNNSMPAQLQYTEIRALLSDDKDGLWIGMGEVGLVYRSVSGEWTIYNTDNSDLPQNWCNTLLSDGSGGLWIGTDRGLAHLSGSGQWTIYNTDNSELHSNAVSVLSSDGNGGLWIGTGSGLAHRSVNGKWTVYNSELPKNGIRALFNDNRGGLWIGTWDSVTWGGGELVYRNVRNEWSIFNTNTSGLPGNGVGALSSDGSGGLWIGMEYDGLAHYSVTEKWTVFNTNNSELPHSQVRALSSDNSGGLWIGTWASDIDAGGLAYRNSNGEWTTYNTNNSELPHNNINALLSDDSGGLWIGTGDFDNNGGLAYRGVNGEWQVFNTNNSGLPKNTVWTLLNDGNGGLWIGTYEGGLVHRSVSNQWTVYNTDNSDLPNNWVRALSSDSNGGLWIGTPSGLAHRSVDDQWKIFYTELPNHSVSVLLNEGSQGLWIGTEYGGLAHRSVNNEWTVFDIENSNLPDDSVSALLSDGNGGLWIGTQHGGLAHLTLSPKNTLCADFEEAQCQTLQQNKRAAIIIAGGGNDNSNSLWDTTSAISNSIYKMFNQRGFDNDEIYYLSPQSYADFNGDGMDDCIVDAPATNRCLITSTANPILERYLTVDDVRQALAYAKGKLDQPLYIFFNDHGGTNRLQLSKGRYLDVVDFKTILDDYQQATGNELVLVIDTCYSGALLEKLIAPNRAIISSTGNDLAYYDRISKQGFSRFLANGLLQGGSFWEAFEYARYEQSKLVQSFSIGKEQQPQWDDGKEGQWLREIYINGSFVTGDTTLTVAGVTASTTLTAGDSLVLKAKADLAQGRVTRVWAVLKPPKVKLVMDQNGTPILAYPRLTLSATQETDLWQSTWRETVYNGEYEITFYAEDNQGNIANSDPILINVIGGVDSPPDANVQLVLEKDHYRFGEYFKALLIENLSWGYDLYVAVVLPDGQFFALKNTNKLAPLNQPEKWLAPRTQNSPLTLLELTLPNNLAKGQYCLYGILSPERENVFETLEKNLWVMQQQCFEVLP